MMIFNITIIYDDFDFGKVILSEILQDIIINQNASLL